MTKIYRYIFILILLFIITPAKIQGANIDVDKKRKPEPLRFSPELIRVESEHIKLTRIDKLMDLLKIRSGMTILEIGTGTGQYAYKFAERLKGTGRVFATDIDINRINYVKEEAQRRGLRNLYPVLVKREGVDEFYSKHKYDLILLAHAYGFFQGQVNYFKKMKDFLSEDGSFVIILYNTPFHKFSLDDFTDFGGLIKELSLEPADSPFYKGLRKSTWELINQKSEGEPDELLKNAIVDVFNQMLLNPHFYNDFQRAFIYKTVSFLPAEKDLKDLYNWLLLVAKERGYWDRPKKDLNDFEIKQLMALNELFIIQRFRQYLYRDGKHPFFSKGDVSKQTVGFLVNRDLEEAGYKLENEYDDPIPFEVILVFKANKDKEGE